MQVEGIVKANLQNWGSALVVLGKKKKPNVVGIEYIMGRMDGASLIAQLVKNPPAMQETPVQFLGQEDTLEKR